MYQLSPEDGKLLLEFLRKERKDFSLELRRALNRLRLVPIAGREVIIALDSNKGWRLARLGARRGDPVRFIDDRVFTDHKRAEWEILKMRWQRLTGTPLPQSADAE
jgi:hypothetical protein